MALGQRQFVVVLLLLMVVSTTAVRMSRSLTVKDEVSLPNFHSQDVEERETDDRVLMKVLERRMTIELADYPGTGANRNHDPRTPGGV